MMSVTAVLVWSAVLTWLMLIASSALRTQGWAPGGIARAMGNRDDLPPPTPLAGRADRAAKNMLENLVIFTALVAAVHFAGKVGALSELGANIFLWARVVYWPVYLAGSWLRSIVWTITIIGLVMIAAAALV
jgi:uncharacterized MAPEG superfamily protein